MTTHTLTIGTAVGAAGTGTVTAAGTNVVSGSGTHFLTDLVDGNGFPLTIQVAGNIYSIEFLNSDTSLTLTSSYTPTFTGAAYTIGSRNLSTLNDASAAINNAQGPYTQADSYILNMYNDSEFVLTGTHFISALLAGGQTIVVQPAAGQSFRDQAGVRTNALKYNATNGVAMRGTFSGFLIRVTTATPVTINGIQFKIDSGTEDSGMFLDATGGSVTINNCIVFAPRPILTSGASPMAVTVNNSVLIATGESAFGIFRLAGGSDAGLLYFCDLVCASDASPSQPAYLMLAAGSTLAMENCAMFGAAALYTSGSGATFTTCMTDITGATGLTGGVTYANQFVGVTNAGGLDFREKAGATLKGAGTADATNGANDISGLARPQSGNWDIGAWELAASATNVPVWLYFGQSLALGAVAKLARDLIRNPIRSRRRMFTGILAAILVLAAIAASANLALAPTAPVSPQLVSKSLFVLNATNTFIANFIP